ncbi:metallophosphoesterase [Asticcacaulis sp. AND118]|uniref:metallophosphoesterase n=1 Tax=Asticcacaulis sp. AND118 TaxID=2840468 RepID=UPI001CFFB6CA|nr:metallophosphoesterase [Asticcacaulis sp. AND118]UDF05435.1 metallophosphoesterase [Asticcacaulis sp. AND118]
MRRHTALCLSLFSLITAPALAEEWPLDPAYDLPRQAAVKPAKAHEGPVLQTPLSAAPLFQGLTATHSQILTSDAVTGDFTLELWIVDHVNQPVGTLLSAGGMRLGYFNDQAAFGGETLQTAKLPEPFKERWHDLVLVRQGHRLSLYHNGVAVAQGNAPTDATTPVRLDSYLGNEPYMIPANLVHVAALERRAMTPTEVAQRFADRAKLVEEGRLWADRFHFTQPPYLSTPQMDSIQLSFEFDRPATATVVYGESEDALQTAPLPATTDRLHGLKLSGLKADTPYFYRVTGTDAAGRKLDSGLLSFRTAPPAGQPFVMVVSGDTEARPHINNRMAQLMWEERPALLAIMGDLTDGGSKEKRFEWTHEYFTGIGAFAGRVPVLGVVGNGEGELQWWRHYLRENMASPRRESYFSLVYGDVEFFTLDANLSEREKEAPGFRERQKAWLEQALKTSKARWKIAMHHQDVRTSDSDDYGDSFREKAGEGDRDVQADFLPLYEKYNVDLVFFAHLHTYERSWPIRANKVDPKTGITYVQVGGLGGNLEDFAPNKPWFSAKTARTHHYVTLNVTPEQIEGRMVDSEGRLRDVFTVHHRTDK